MSDVTRTIKPGASTRFNGKCDFILIKTSTGNALLVLDDGERVLMEQGDKKRLKAMADGFDIENPGAADVTVRAIYGEGDYTPGQLVGQITGTVEPGAHSGLDGIADHTWAAVATDEIAAVNLNRKAITIKALSTNTGIIRLGGAAAAAGIGLELVAGEAVTLNTTAAIYGYADTINDAVSMVEET